MAETSNLIVPMAVDALCVGRRDSLEVAVKLAGRTVDFSLMPWLNEDGQAVYRVNRAYTSSTLLRSPGEDSDRNRLTRGVHLHWTLPAGLAQGAQVFRLSGGSLRKLRGKLSSDAEARLEPLKGRDFDSEAALLSAMKERLGPDSFARFHALVAEAAEKEVKFQPIPNRWLITRRGARGGAALPERQWVLESDLLMTEADYLAYAHETGRVCVSVPVEGSSDAPFRYLGRVFDRESWAEGAASGERLRNLTSVGYSGPAFAAYYPDCSSVLGFHDTFKGEPWPDGETLLSYHVAGWYSDPAKDPVRGLPSDAVRGRYGWDFPADEPAPARAVLSGGVSEVAWDPGRSYLSTERPLKDVEVAIGHTTTEALSAVLSREWLRRQPARAGAAQRADVESLLDALQLGLLPRLGPNFGLAKLEEALYQSGFESEEGGNLWAIRKKESRGSLGDGEDPGGVFPPELKESLDALAELQLRYDEASFELASRREQLFLDWYKYIHTLYESPADASKQAFLLTEEIDAIKSAERAAGRLVFDAENGLVSTSSPADSLAARIVAEVNRITATLAAKKASFVLERSGAPRFWQPQDPVLLLSGEELRSMRTGAREALACRLSDSGPEDLAARGGQETRKWSPPWRPAFLFWKVRYRPVIKSGEQKYSPGFVTDSFALDGDSIDYAFKSGRVAEEIYEGTSLLSERAAFGLADQIRQYAKTYPEQDAAKRLAPLAEMVEAMPLLSQSLNGLHQAFLMREQILQTQVGDPTGSDNNLSDTEVRAAVADMNRRAPLPSKGFNPVRGGFLEVSELQIIDAFGQRAVLREPGLTRSERMTADAAFASRAAYLAPRLCQPSRLLFRWLDSERDSQALNPSPAATPVCGWLVPNHLDASLMLYDVSGRAIGSLGLEGKKKNVIWRKAPGSASSAAGMNPHLLDFVRMFADPLPGASGPAPARKSKAFFADMLQAIEDSYSRIIPANDPQLSLAVLIGRPVALVRASLRLQLQGLPACALSWSAFNHDLRSALAGKDDVGPRYDPLKRETAGFLDVKFPVRLGDGSQTDDGLVGFFREGDPDEVFYSPSAGSGLSGGVKRPAGMEVQLDASSKETILTMLVDPRNAVNAVSGVLPVKSIDIPPALWADALRKIEATFFANPVLSRRDELIVPLPREAGFKWSWVSSGSADRDLAEGRSDDRARFSGTPVRLHEGWLKLARSEDGPKQK